MGLGNGNDKKYKRGQSSHQQIGAGEEWHTC